MASGRRSGIPRRGAARAGAAGGCLLAAACALSGCVSTQQKNARAKLTAERELASREPLHVGASERRVTVERVALVRGSGETALVVTLRNRAATPLTDLPIAIGISGAGGRRTVLNGRRGLGWFETHVPSVGAGARVEWVFSARARAVPPGRPWARVGAPTRLSSAASLPRLVATVTTGDGKGSARGGRGAVARVVVRNDSDVPQRDLQLVALAGASGRWTAAGRARIAELGARAQARATVPLTGRFGAGGSGAVTVQALPTIFE
ncbi:hypothetical protein Q5424_12380 [Conexibacter sp. JD483]|uniref:hypothetical protein n=1 Tax=unclassified Conexibacter TaxID=2627773 RepID=UPI00272152EC|nr:MULTISPECIES: hypothetical protein [unclassified Conexibacter]MDO8187475.1 hypothetical protein [Conexibacter sp. CPCC 205706]MDO8198709.1 hypothetical protein [Conexibacter sp. CPCC 205762]MDR9369887.1 hypothetical protein [Conexibacter sp. JD483]